MRVDTPYHDFLAFWRRAEDAAREEQERLWGELYAARHPALMEHYLGLFAGDGALGAALPRFGEVAEDLHDRFEALELEQRAREVVALLDAPAPPRAIAMVGLFTADAWSDDFEGEPVAFFALEALPRNRVLSAHELAHSAHRLACGEYWTTEPGLILLGEGVAIATTTRLHPDATAEEHFNVPDFASWRASCDDRWTHAVDSLLGCLAARGLRQLQRFFWPDWGRADRDVPPRVGYLIAARVIDVLLEEHDLAEIARWPAERALPEVRAALEALR